MSWKNNEILDLKDDIFELKCKIFSLGLENKILKERLETSNDTVSKLWSALQASEAKFAKCMLDLKENASNE